MKDTPAHSTEALIEAAVRVYFERLERGEAVEREAFLARYPAIADTLWDFIKAEEELRKLAGDKASRESAGISTQSFASQVQETVTQESHPVSSPGLRSSDLLGQFGRYRVIRTLGRGAMGTVYLAQDTQVERLIALKTPHFTPEPSPEQKERFFREARAAGSLRHQNICPVHDFGQIDGRPYISMAYIEGRTLSAFMLHHPLASDRTILTAIRKLALALQEAHDHGIVHRDLKPSNIIVDTKDEPIITDFGLAHESERGGDARLTRPGISIGTPAFMSPEQVQGNPAKIGPATDQYSLGVILYEWLTGRLPFEGPPLLVMGEILSKEPIRPRQLLPQLEHRIEALCLKMMAKSPSARFASMAEVATEISAILDSLSDETKGENSVDDQALPDVKTGVNRRVADDGNATWISHSKQLASSRKGRFWIRWAVAGASLAAFGLLAAVIVVYLGKTAILIDIKDPDVQVALNGTALVVTGPSQQSVKVEPGEQELTITCAGLETTTKSFTIKKGEKKAVTISVLNSQLVARLDSEIGLQAPSGVQETATRSAGPIRPSLRRPPAEVRNEVVKTPAKERAADTVANSPTVERKPHVATATVRSFGPPFFIRGDWAIENDELVQSSLAATTWTGDYYPLLVFGDETWSNYDLTLEAKKTGGRDTLGVFFHWLGPGRYRSLSLRQNKEIDFSYKYRDKPGQEDGSTKELTYSSNRWYSLKLEARGDTFRAFLDGVLLFEQTDSRFTHGRICLYTNNAAARFRRIKVSDLQGTALCEGLPDLTTAGDNIAQTDVSNSQPPLTARETAAKNDQQQWARRSNTPVVLTNSLGMKLALIPPGDFQMGSPMSEKDRAANEHQHRVLITKPFYLGVYEVTQSEFGEVMGRNPSAFSNGGGRTEAATGVDTSRYPVERVNWYDAVEFCNKLSEKEGRQPYYRFADIEREAGGWLKVANVAVRGGDGYRLPTEAEWEYACRAGTTTPFNFGAVNNGAECNCNDRAPYLTEARRPALGRTTQVGNYRANALGLYDMHGNVWEWCWDVKDDAYYSHSPAADPAGPLFGSQRVNRGGSWGSDPAYCRAGVRFSNMPVFASDNLGLRVACSLRQ